VNRGPEVQTGEFVMITTPVSKNGPIQ